MIVKHICKFCGTEFHKDEKSKKVYCSGACRYDAILAEKRIQYIQSKTKQ